MAVSVKPNSWERRSGVSEVWFWKLKIEMKILLLQCRPVSCPRRSLLWVRGSWGGKENGMVNRKIKTHTHTHTHTHAHTHTHTHTQFTLLRTFCENQIFIEILDFGLRGTFQIKHGTEYVGGLVRRQLLALLFSDFLFAARVPLIVAVRVAGVSLAHFGLIWRVNKSAIFAFLVLCERLELCANRFWIKLCHKV